MDATFLKANPSHGRIALIARLALSMMVVGEPACGSDVDFVALDNGETGPAAEDETPPVPDDLSLDPNISLGVRFDATIQLSRWGNRVGRCTLSLAFTRLEETGPPPPPAPELWEPMRFPDQAGTCAVTKRNPVEMQRRMNEASPPPDNWFIEGTLDAGDYVYLHGKHISIELERREDDPGRIHYDIADCDLETYPFGERFDLDVPEGLVELDQDPFLIEDALVVGPELIVESPADDDLDEGRWIIPQDEGVEMRWSFAGLRPGGVEDGLAHRMAITFRNNIKGGVQEFQALACLPDPVSGDEGTLSIDGATLRQLNANAAAGVGPYDLLIQIDSAWMAPPVEMPWGRYVQLGSQMSISGRGELVRRW